MLQHCGKIFLKVSAIDRKSDVPTIFIDIIDRKSRKFIGQIRFNHDSNYVGPYDCIRMSFDVCDTYDIDPSNPSNILEDIIVGGIVWLTTDNHRTYRFVPKVYMAVHAYEDDPAVMKSINNKTIQILKNLGCINDASNGTWSSSNVTLNHQYIFSVVNRD